MSGVITFDPVDTLGAGAFGQPGQRTFVIQARKGAAMLSVLVEKEQVALLASEAQQFLDLIAKKQPEPPATFVETETSGPVEEDEPLFRARLIGIGYDEERELVLIELREDDVDQDEDDEPEDPDESADPDESEGEGHVARLYATRAQVRAMVQHGAAAVDAGRPRCQLCDFPMDPGEPHVCPRWN